MNRLLGFLPLFVIGLTCSRNPPIAIPDNLSVSNETDQDTVVYFSFGADSKVLSSNWSSFCKATSDLNCSFALKAHASHGLPTAGQYLNATLAFNGQVGCGSTKAELNVNNPKWYDTLDISLVDGYNNNISITTTPSGTPIVLGPVVSKTGNEKIMGVFPYGCDICTARQNPPCGISKGTDGCKGGTQYKPDVPCQYQGPIMGGGNTLTKVSLIK